MPSSSSSSSAMSCAESGCESLRAVAIERVRLEAELPGEQVGFLAVLDRRLVRHVDGLGDRARDERLRRRHHADVALDREVALAGAAARVGAVEHRVVLGLQVRRAFDRHRAADMHVRGLDLALGEAEVRRAGRRSGEASASAAMPSFSRQKSSPSVHLLNANLMSKAVGSAFSTLAMASSSKPLALQRRVVDAGRLAERAVADRVGLDLGDLGLRVAERAQRFRHRAVDDLEVAAAGELLELHQREVGLDAGGVAVHHQADRAGRRDHGRLRVAVAVLLRRARAPCPRRPWRAPSCRRRACRCWSHGRAAPAAATRSRSRSSRHRPRGDGCASRAACARGSSCSRGTAPSCFAISAEVA